jgi:hypothetical protein
MKISTAILFSTIVLPISLVAQVKGQKGWNPKRTQPRVVRAKAQKMTNTKSSQRAVVQQQAFANSSQQQIGTSRMSPGSTMSTNQYAPLNMKSFSAKGFRLALLKPSFTTGEMSASGTNVRTGEVTDLATFHAGEYGLAGMSLGYVYLPVNAVGWSGSFVYATKSESGDRLNVMKLDGNIGFALNKYVSIKAGPNVVYLNGNGSEGLSRQYRPSLGWQISTGIQFNRNIGLDLSWLNMGFDYTVEAFRQGSGEKTYDFTYVGSMSGPELALHWTF